MKHLLFLTHSDPSHAHVTGGAIRTTQVIKNIHKQHKNEVTLHILDTQYITQGPYYSAKESATIHTAKINKHLPYKFRILQYIIKNAWNIIKLERKLGKSLIITDAARAPFLSLRLAQLFSRKKLSYVTYVQQHPKDIIAGRQSIFRSIQNSTHIFVVSSHYKKLLTQKGILEKHITETTNGIDTTIFFPTNKQPQYDVIALGMLHKNKGTDQLLTAWAKVIQEKPDAKLLLVGDNRLEDPIQNAKQQNITIEPSTNQKEAATYINQSRVLVMASPKESFGLVIGEALACGKPVIASNIQEVRNIWKNTIQYCNAQDTQCWSTTILRLLKNPGEADKTSIAKILQAMRWEDIAEKEYKILYQTQ